MPLIGFAWKVMFTLTAFALIVFFATPSATLGYLAKLFALDIGSSMLILLAYPHVRGVRMGDQAYVREDIQMPILFVLPNATILDNGRLNGFVRVEFRDKTTGIGKIVKYQGLITHAEIQLLEKNIQAEVSN